MRIHIDFRNKKTPPQDIYHGPFEIPEILSLIIISFFYDFFQTPLYDQWSLTSTVEHKGKNRKFWYSHHIKITTINLFGVCL